MCVCTIRQTVILSRPSISLVGCSAILVFFLFFPYFCYFYDHFVVGNHRHRHLLHHHHRSPSTSSPSSRKGTPILTVNIIIIIIIIALIIIIITSSSSLSTSFYTTTSFIFISNTGFSLFILLSLSFLTTTITVGTCWPLAPSASRRVPKGETTSSFPKAWQRGKGKLTQGMSGKSITRKVTFVVERKR